MDVDTGDNFGIMEVVSTSGGITLKNDDSVTLGADDKVDIMGSMYFKVADDTNTLRYYLAKTVSLECEECPEIPVCPDCPTPEPCEPCPEVTPETVEVIKYINVTAEPVEDNTLPGFGVVLPLAGLLIVAYFIIKQKD